MMTLNKTTVILSASVVASSLLLKRLWSLRRKSYLDIPPELISGTYAEEVKLAVRCAIEAGKNMMPLLDSKGTTDEDTTNRSLDISTKTCDADFCTIIDIQNEAFITSAIKHQFPQHIVIGEESTGTQLPELLTDKPTWVIDPIDGASDF